ncbi:hypothetical protein [Clostridium ihumii]|uniref:hypothetical protein n=1 Tax=Clostridium ihumii TaxID=1470356 RepID=UPI00054D6BDD|nr:hypothetical protein [Clostridium ihumii]
MKVGKIIKNNQPDIYIKLEKHNKKKKEKLSERDLKQLMGNYRYKRGPGGAIRQVGFGGK